MAQVRQAGQQRGFSNLGQEHSEWMFSWPVFMRFTCTRFFESNYPMNLIESSPTYGVDTPGIRGAENGVLINV